MGRNAKSSKQWKKFPVTLDFNYKSRLNPVTKNIRELYKELIEPELEKISDFEYIETDKKSFDDSVEIPVEKKFHEFRVKYYGQSFPLNGDPKTLAWRNKVEKQIKIEGNSVANTHKNRFKSNVNFVLGVDPLKNEPWLTGVLKDWTAQNVSLIKGIPDFAIDSMQATIMESVRRGDSRTFLKNQLAKILTDSDKRLKLIARDQTNKLYGALTKFRSQENGWDFYEWSDSNDSRVRKDHERLDNISNKGGFFRFSDPPVIVTTGKRANTRGNPGDDILCRCVAIVSFLPEWRFKAASDGSYRLIPVQDLPPQDQKRIA
jgi:SPP1 gp7 family putative phage head morphogenesis protein